MLDAGLLLLLVMVAGGIAMAKWIENRIRHLEKVLDRVRDAQREDRLAARESENLVIHLLHTAQIERSGLTKDLAKMRGKVLGVAEDVEERTPVPYVPSRFARVDQVDE